MVGSSQGDTDCKSCAHIGRHRVSSGGGIVSFSEQDCVDCFSIHQINTEFKSTVEETLCDGWEGNRSVLRKKKPEGRSQRGDDACSLVRGTRESAAIAASVGMSHWRAGFHGGNL